MLAVPTTLPCEVIVVKSVSSMRLELVRAYNFPLYSVRVPATGVVALEVKATTNCHAEVMSELDDLRKNAALVEAEDSLP